MPSNMDLLGSTGAIDPEINWKTSLPLRLFEEIRAAHTIVSNVSLRENEELLKAYVVQLVYSAARDLLDLCTRYPKETSGEYFRKYLRRFREDIEPLKAGLGLGPNEVPSVASPVINTLRYETVVKVIDSIKTISSNAPGLKIPDMDHFAFHMGAW